MLKRRRLSPFSPKVKALQPPITSQSPWIEPGPWTKLGTVISLTGAASQDSRRRLLCKLPNVWRQLVVNLTWKKRCTSEVDRACATKSMKWITALSSYALSSILIIYLFYNFSCILGLIVLVFSRTLFRGKAFSGNRRCKLAFIAAVGIKRRFREKFEVPIAWAHLVVLPVCVVLVRPCKRQTLRNGIADLARGREYRFLLISTLDPFCVRCRHFWLVSYSSQ
jgi:hypothetical protein